MENFGVCGIGKTLYGFGLVDVDLGIPEMGMGMRLEIAGEREFSTGEWGLLHSS